MINWATVSRDGCVLVRGLLCPELLSPDLGGLAKPKKLETDEESNPLDKFEKSSGDDALHRKEALQEEQR